MTFPAFSMPAGIDCQKVYSCVHYVYQTTPYDIRDI